MSLTLQNVNTGAVEEYTGCVDDMAFPLAQLQLKKHDEVNASVDELRKESKTREETSVQVQAAALGAIIEATQRIELASTQTAATALLSAPPDEEGEQLAIDFAPAA